MADKFSKSVKNGRKSLSGKSGGKTKSSTVKSTGKSSKSGKIKITGSKNAKLVSKTINTKSGGAFKSLKNSGKTISGKSGGVKTSVQSKVSAGFKSKVIPSLAKSGLSTEVPKRAALLPVPEAAKEPEIVNPIASSMGSRFFGVPGEDDLAEAASKLVKQDRHSKMTPQSTAPPLPTAATSDDVDSESCSFSVTRLPTSDAPLPQPKDSTSSKSTTPSREDPLPPVTLSQFRVPSRVPAEPTSASLQSLDTGNSLSSDASSGSSIDITTNSPQLKK